MRKNPYSDLQGMLNLIKASKNPFSPIVEALNNSLESIFKLDESGDRNITIELYFNDQDESSKRLEFIEITDSGAGFNKESFERFERLLDRSKGFNNRGSGRLQYLHRFGEVSVKSIYRQNEDYYLREFSSCKNNFIYDDSVSELIDKNNLKTTVTLKQLRNHKQDNNAYSKLKFSSFVSWVKSQFALRAYLELTKGKVFPTINLKFTYQVAEDETLTIKPDDFPKPTDSGDFYVNYQESFDDNGDIGWRKPKGFKPEKFSWCVFSFPAEDVDIHGAFLCSKDIPVEEVKNSVLKKSNGHLGHKMITAFYGDFLDKPDNVNHSVDSFTIPSKADVKELSNSIFDTEAEVYIDDIIEQANKQLKLIYKEIELAQESAERKVMLLAKELGISNHIAMSVKKVVKLSDNEEIITKNLHIEEAKYVADKSNKARKVIEQLELMDPTAANYQKDLEKKSEELSSLIGAQNKEELSKYVVRRELVAKLLDKILNNDLIAQTKDLSEGKSRRDKEGFIHDLVFKRKSNGNLNDLWILDEEFIYFDSFSDVPLNKIQSESGVFMLKDIPEEEIKKLQLKIAKRPDIFIFADEGKCVLVEFKAADIDLSEHLQQTEKYCTLIANFSTKKIEKFYCYLIGEDFSPFDLPSEYDQTVSGTWLREKIKIIDKTAMRNVIAYGQQELIKLSDIATRAHRRNKSFAEKLGMDTFID
ncbi:MULTISPECIES: hypothetical protein [unclassified Pseudoalteromonas]|jgi:hypothetical protein|uniref:hypothetical protein n=1 Tax=unclassified Pseudoalteromonas TaxID=194690 RepID=UPI0015FF90C5|nr:MULTISPECIES: hypothetical protein [unclassified Pseudoalteromonas]MBB1348383.1 hypothetical protein [Pseudoalteromonas sp. SG45-3]MBB1358017.1 hypothetical protein [Pseudoalteromonas sp. SG45-6]